MDSEAIKKAVRGNMPMSIGVLVVADFISEAIFIASL